MSLDRIGRQVLLPASQDLHEPVLGDDAADIVSEALEDQPFAARELDRLGVDLQLVSVQIDRQAAQSHDAGRGEAGAADQGPTASRELRLFERLHEKIVGAQIEGADLVGQRIAGGQDQHRHRLAFMAQRAQQRQSIRSGQTDVDHRQIKMLGA